MRLGNGGPFVWPQLVGAEARYPHVPVALQIQLHVFHLDACVVPMTRKHAGGVYCVLNKIVGDLKQQLFDIFVELLGWVDLTDQLL